MNDDGSFGEAVEDTAGVYIRCDDVRVIEFRAPEEDVATGDSGNALGHNATGTEGGLRGEEVDED
jgi:hypothetical protein